MIYIKVAMHLLIITFLYYMTLRQILIRHSYGQQNENCNDDKVSNTELPKGMARRLI